MHRPPYYRVFIKEDSNHFLAFRLFQQKSDESLMIKIEPSDKPSGARVGKIPITPTDELITIPFKSINTPAEIDHTNIHARGSSHTKMKDGSLSINYSEQNPATPLQNLKTVKHLATIVARPMGSTDNQEPNPTDGRRAAIIDRQKGQNCSIFDLLAVPVGVNLKFNFEWDMKNERPVKLNVGYLIIPFNGFNVFILSRHSDQFDKLPQHSVHLGDMNNIVPMIVSVSDKDIKLRLSGVTFEEIKDKPNHDNPYDGFTVLSATSKYL